MTIKEFNGQMKAEGRKEEASHLDELIEEAYAEAQRGAGVTTPEVVCVAKKRPVPYAVRAMRFLFLDFITSLLSVIRLEMISGPPYHFRRKITKYALCVYSPSPRMSPRMLYAPRS